jgi:hypothetical protein
MAGGRASPDRFARRCIQVSGHLIARLSRSIATRRTLVRDTPGGGGPARSTRSPCALATRRRRVVRAEAIRGKKRAAGGGGRVRRDADCIFLPGRAGRLILSRSNHRSNDPIAKSSGVSPPAICCCRLARLCLRLFAGHLCAEPDRWRQ